MDKPRILIIDDEDEIREMLRNFISKKILCEIKESRSGEESLGFIEKEEFDLVFLDIKMPGISGIDILKKIKHSSPSTEVIMITGYDSPQVAQELFRVGADDYIPKPLSVELILNKIKDFLMKKNKYLPR